MLVHRVVLAVFALFSAALVARVVAIPVEAVDIKGDDEVPDGECTAFSVITRELIVVPQDFSKSELCDMESIYR